MKKRIAFKEKTAASFDGTRIYYNVTGSGLPLVCTDGFACDMYIWRYIVERFSASHRVVRWNYRGHGRSEKPADMTRLSIEDCADDLAAVMEDAGIDRAVHLGHSMGVQVILEFYRRHPEKVLGLVPVCGSYGKPLSTFHNSEMLHRLFPLLRGAIHKRPRRIVDLVRSRIVPTRAAFIVSAMTELNRALARERDFRPFLKHLSTLDLDVFTAMLGYARNHTAKDLLPEIKVPVLIFGAENDSFTPLRLSREMNRLIPKSEFQFLPLCSHAAPLELPDLVGLRLEKFLSDHFPAKE